MDKLDNLGNLGLPIFANLANLVLALFANFTNLADLVLVIFANLANLANLAMFTIRKTRKYLTETKNFDQNFNRFQRFISKVQKSWRKNHSYVKKIKLNVA